jgi:hypothetical protein
LFEDYITSGENWLQSSIYINATRTDLTEKKGTYVVVTFKDLVEKHGKALAGELRKRKKELQTKESGQHWMRHPDFPLAEDWELKVNANTPYETHICAMVC